MKKLHTKRKRPGVLVRFPAEDLQLLNGTCYAACTPRENYIRRVTMMAVREAVAMARRVAATAASPPTPPRRPSPKDKALQKLLASKARAR